MSEGSFRILPATLCGGSGARLWPASLESKPKQFIDVLGPYSTVQLAIQPVPSSRIFSRPAAILSSAALSIVAYQLAQIRVEAEPIKP
jgi:mannose-1-phosphate guanylyltransferase/mannose-6-phosphate isomerase